MNECVGDIFQEKGGVERDEIGRMTRTLVIHCRRGVRWKELRKEHPPVPVTEDENPIQKSI